MDDEISAPGGFAEQREPGDRERAAVEIRKVPQQRLLHARDVVGRHPPGQRHVEAEGIEDVRIAPLYQVLALLAGKLLRPAPGDVGGGKRRAEAFEATHNLAREELERCAFGAGHQREEGAEAADHHFGNIEAVELRRKPREFRQQLGLRTAFGHFEGSLQGGVEAVATGVGGQGGQRFG